MHQGKTDLQLLHRLFLQYCWQWPFYGATFFEAELPRGRKVRNEAIRIGFTTDWCTFISGDTNQLKAQISLDQLTHIFADAEPGMMQISCADSSAIAELKPARSASTDLLEIASLQASLIDKLLKKMRHQMKAAQDEILKKRRAQDGPLVISHVSEAPRDREKDEAEMRAFRTRFSQELNYRHTLTDTFGEKISTDQKPFAQTLLEGRPSADDFGAVPMSELKNVFMEFGYGCTASHRRLVHSRTP